MNQKALYLPSQEYIFVKHIQRLAAGEVRLIMLSSFEPMGRPWRLAQSTVTALQKILSNWILSSMAESCLNKAFWDGNFKHKSSILKPELNWTFSTRILDFFRDLQTMIRKEDDRFSLHSATPADRIVIFLFLRGLILRPSDRYNDPALPYYILKRLVHFPLGEFLKPHALEKSLSLHSLSVQERLFVLATPDDFCQTLKDSFELIGSYEPAELLTRLERFLDQMLNWLVQDFEKDPSMVYLFFPALNFLATKNIIQINYYGGTMRPQNSSMDRMSLSTRILSIWEKFYMGFQGWLAQLRKISFVDENFDQTAEVLKLYDLFFISEFASDREQMTKKEIC